MSVSKEVVAGVIDFSRPGPIGIYRDGITHLTPAEALALSRRGVILVDLREAYETNFRTFDLDEVIYLEMSRFTETYGGLPQDKPLILADATGTASKRAIVVLKAAGYTNLANLIGGMIEWEKDGLPVRKDADYELSGQCSCKLKPRIGGNPLKERPDAGLKVKAIKKTEQLEDS